MNREARANVKLKAKLKKEKKLFRQLWKGTKEVTAELEQRVAQLSDAKTELDQKEAQLSDAKKELSQIFIVAERRERQIRHLQNVVGKLHEKRDEPQLESAMTEMKPVPELDWEGNFNIERNRRELAEATVRSLRSKVARLEKDLKDSREDNVMFPKGTLITFPAGSELRFL